VGHFVERLTVALAERSYDIIISAGSLAETGRLCRDASLSGRVAVVTNPTVGALYYETVFGSLTAAGYDVFKIELPDGEEHKNLTTLTSIYTELIRNGFDRGCFLLALGGGVIGDMTGFAAASFLRGVPFVQIPTTLLAQVDSSVGGKTGVNHDLGKNLIGAFHQPRLVISDVETLATLDPRDFVSGLAEVVKYGVILDADFFSYLHDHQEQILLRQHDVLEYLVRRCCELKADVVSEDERESGVRAVLNYGHTLGHAVEALAGYERYRHGEAVAMGMVQAAAISEKYGYADHAATVRIIQLIKGLRLPHELPNYSADEYVAVLLRDKKVREKGLTFICNRGIGGFCFMTVSDVTSLLLSIGYGGRDGRV
jgi:3-dehydroquinate synthase